MTKSSVLSPLTWPRLCARGVLIWLVPFVLAIPLMGRDGQPTLDPLFFKTIMLLVGGATGGWMLATTLPRAPQPLAHSSLKIGLCWLSINAALDVVVLLPMSGMTFGAWLTQIGLRYLSIPITCFAAGVAIDRSIQRFEPR